MKIISGTLKGRTVNGYDIEGTRPTMDRVKESLFGIIQDSIKNSVVLDLFAGSGNLGFEAISNGASKCYFNDINKKCSFVVKKNIKIFNVEDKAVVLSLNYNKALIELKNDNIKFDIIFLDPPYKMECLNEIIKLIKDYDLINKNGLIVCEVDSLYLNIDFYNKIKEKKYGDKYVIIYKNNL